METDPSLRLRVTLAGSSKRDHPVMLSGAKHLVAHGDRPFASAQRLCPERSEWGDTVRHFRLMRIRADKSSPTGVRIRLLHAIIASPQGESRMDARFYNADDIDIEQLATNLENVYRAQGFQAQHVGNNDQIMVQLKKGSDFEAIIGLQAALSVIL